MGRKVNSFKSVPHLDLGLLGGVDQRPASAPPPPHPPALSSYPPALPHRLPPGTHSGLGCISAAEGGAVRGKGSTLICLLKSHTHPQSYGSLAQLSRFPSCLLFPSSGVLSRAGSGHEGLPAQNPPHCPNSGAWQAPSGSALVRAEGGGRRMTPSAAGPVDLRWEERLSATVPAPHPRAGRGGWEAPSAQRRKEGEGRARRVVLARKRRRASATRSWGGCPGDAPPQGAAMPPKPPGAPPPQELGPEPYVQNDRPHARPPP